MKKKIIKTWADYANASVAEKKKFIKSVAREANERQRNLLKKSGFSIKD